MPPQLPLLDLHPMLVLHEVVPCTMAFLPQPGTLALPLPAWLTTLDGWLTLAETVMGEQLPDKDRNCFLLDLLGAEGKQQLDWDVDVDMMEMGVTTMTHADFRATIQLCLQPINAPSMASTTPGRPLLG